MGSMEDAFRKAGVAPPEAPAAAVPEPPAERPCAKCGKTFRPARAQHKLCDECITSARAERAAGEAPARSAEPGGARPADGAPMAAHAPRGDRDRGDRGRDRPPRREPGAQRSAFDRPQPAQAGSPESGHAPGHAPDRAPDRPTGRRPDFAPPRGDRGDRYQGPRGLPAGYLEGGYFGSGGALRRELFTDWAEQIAHGVAIGPPDPTAHQLRAFQNHVRRAVAAVKFGGRPIALALNEVQKLKPIVAERASRRKVSEQFRQFVEANVDRVTDEKTLMAFAEHFQAVAAYAGGLLHTRKERR